MIAVVRKAGRPRAGPWPFGPWVAVVGARPNFVKLAPLIAAAEARGRRLLWIHTAQHRDRRLTQALWRDLSLPPPVAVSPHVPPGPGRVALMATLVQLALQALRPSLVVVVGDVDSTLAGALAADDLGVPVAHVEAGLRTGERRLPEELNRTLADRLSALLHASEPSAARNLRAEGFARRSVHMAGNVMADALEQARPRLVFPGGRLARLEGRPFGVVTLHRGGNVDRVPRWQKLVEALLGVAALFPLVFPVHPRTRQAMGGRRRGTVGGRVMLVPPLSYLEFLGLVSQAQVVLTDSGGLPVEASLLGVPCVTLRARYEHTLTLTHGTNCLSGSDPRRIPAAVRSALSAPRAPRPLPPAWDGHAAERIVARWEAQTE